MDGPIEDVPVRYRPSAEVGGILVNRGEPDPIITGDDRFSGVAMVLPDRDPFAAHGESRNVR